MTPTQIMTMFDKGEGPYTHSPEGVEAFVEDALQAGCSPLAIIETFICNQMAVPDHPVLRKEIED